MTMIYLKLSQLVQIFLLFSVTLGFVIRSPFFRGRAIFGTQIELEVGGSFDTEVFQSKQPVIVDFMANWCGPCKLTAPIFKSLAEDFDDVKFVKVDTDLHEDTVDQFNIQGLPLFALFVDGKIVATHSGAISKEPLREFIKKNLAKARQ